MPTNLDDQLVVAISSRALFNFEEENAVFTEGDPLPYKKLQLDRLDQPAREGIAFQLVKKLLAFNGVDEKKVEVVILSRNDPVSGLRVFKSAEHHNLPITRGVFMQGRSPFPYLNALKADIFLSAHQDDVRVALDAGFPAARVYPASVEASQAHPDEVRIAFDGDAVLFSDQAERVFQEGGISAFEAHETSRATEPLPPGPLQPFLRALHRLQRNPPRDQRMRIRTALVTSRSAPAHDRAIRTLMSWDIEVDEAMFLGGLEKGPFLHVFEPDFYFDDQLAHVQSAAQVSVSSGHVEGGIVNRMIRSRRTEKA
ncbi:MAG: 5'-nucleotidase [Burkholderiales bacterium]|nr:5'-nucleotidase [Burkholderiales bacterium]